MYGCVLENIALIKLFSQENNVHRNNLYMYTEKRKEIIKQQLKRWNMAGDYPNAKNVGLTNECNDALQKAAKIRQKTPLFLMREYIMNGALADIEADEISNSTQASGWSRTMKGKFYGSFHEYRRPG